MPAKKTFNLFVYGTLRAKNSRNHIMTNTFVKEIKTRPLYTMISLGAFPAILEKGRTAIKGELHKIDKTLLARIDIIEGHPDFYERKEVILSDGEKAIAYFRPIIEDGYWDENKTPK